MAPSVKQRHQEQISPKVVLKVNREHPLVTRMLGRQKGLKANHIKEKHALPLLLHEPGQAVSVFRVFISKSGHRHFIMG